jgi:hypothetical protein
MNSIHYIIISIIGLLFFLISHNNYKDKFFNEKILNYENDGKMNFDYLLNSNHKTNILNKYYLDDDIKVNGRRLNTHPYQFKNYKNLYGIVDYQHTDNNNYGAYNTFADYIYNIYGVRR